MKAEEFPAVCARFPRHQIVQRLTVRVFQRNDCLLPVAVSHLARRGAAVGAHMLGGMEPMRPADPRELRSPRTSAETRVQQAVVTVCAMPFVVLVIARAPLWGWAVALVCGLVVVSLTEYLLRRRSSTRTN